MPGRYLTKSLFRIATECETKLYYTCNKEYANCILEDDFIESLAEGGFQVGALARAYHPKGIVVDKYDYDEAVKETSELLLEEASVIFEGAIRYRNSYSRTDILIKQGNELQLIEVKAKSIDPNRDTFINNKGNISSSWRGYLDDISFQRYVLQNAYPQLNVNAYLMLVDKSSVCPSTGLNQKFRIWNVNNKLDNFFKV